MRGSIVSLAVVIALSCASPALPQQNAKQSKRSVPPASPDAVTQTVTLVDKDRARGQTIFKEWAKAMRESLDASRKMTNKKAADRQSWATRSAKAKEDKIRGKYRLSHYQLFLIIKGGVTQKWPTDKPEDIAVVEPILAVRQNALDATIFEEELNEWVKAHAPSTAGRTMSLGQFNASLQQGIFDAAALRKNAPTNACKAKLPDGRTCLRKFVGPPNRNSYEHRLAAPADEQ